MENKNLKTLKDILNERRRQVNIAFEGKDEKMLAHMHTFINKFEEEATQEAIKWVKFFEGTNEYKPDKEDWLEFFNITKENLN